MKSLNTRTKKFNIVISDKDNKLNNDTLTKALNSYNGLYAYIKHDKDVNDDGEVKTQHYHIVLYNTKVKRLSTLINELANMLDISYFAIQIDVCQNIEGSLQYLIHKNDLDKQQYDKSSIITNINLTELDIMLTCDNGALSLDRIIAIVQNADTLLDVIKSVGFGYYHIYRNTIKDIWNSIKIYRG